MSALKLGERVIIRATVVEDQRHSDLVHLRPEGTTINAWMDEQCVERDGEAARARRDAIAADIYKHMIADKFRQAELGFVSTGDFAASCAVHATLAKHAADAFLAEMDRADGSKEES